MNTKQLSDSAYKLLELVIMHPEFKEKIGTPLVQNKFKLGYLRAVSIIDELCAANIIVRPGRTPFPSFCSLAVPIDELSEIVKRQTA